MEEDSYIVSNFHSICRLCLRKSGVMSPLFDHALEGAGLPLYAALAEIAALQIRPDDGLPARICHRCLFQSEKCVEFRSQCAESDAKLRRLTRKLPARQLLSELGDDADADRREDDDVRADLESGLVAATATVAPEPDYLAEDSVVMVVDPSQDYDTSDASDGADPGEALEAGADAVEGDEDESLASKVFMCQYCDQAFTEAERCREHERLEHDARAPWGCLSCGLVFAERAGQAAHARSVHACARPYACAQCDKAFGRRSDLRKHSVVHTGVRPYRCNFCLKSFSRNTNLSKHLRIHSGQKPHVCPQCPRSFISKGDLSRHALVHSGAKPFNCSVCSLSFGRRDKLAKHEARHARAAEPEAAAKESGEERESMVIQLDPYKNLGDEPDSEAGFDERDLPRVPDHIAGEGFSFEARSPDRGSDDAFDDNEEPAKNAIRCALCPRRFASAVDHNSHMQLHEGTKSFHCGLCDKTFMRKRELDRHAVVHTGFKPYECGHCKKRFGRKDKLVRHERIHDEKKDYNCFECPSTFSRKDTLMAHIKTHFPDFSVEDDVDGVSDDPDGDVVDEEMTVDDG